MSEKEELSLKIMVDSKAKKVIFAEARKEFVDFLFHLMSLPLATVVKLLKNEGMTGSLPGLYKSVECLKTEYFEPNANKDTVLLPKLLAFSLPKLSLYQAPSTFTYFRCPDHNCVSDRSGGVCAYYSYCGKTMTEVTHTYAKQSSSGNAHQGFVKESVAYMVMDNLEVKPMSMTLIKSLVSDFDYLVEEEVKCGLNEGLALLRASFETSDVLTTVFLGSKTKIRMVV